MSLHPIKALDHVLEEYRDYLRTEFRAKDPELRAALERELDSPGFLAQEPFYQAHRPFKNGQRWRDLPIDPRLAQVMENRSRSAEAYLHQSEAIRELLSPDPQSVVVTTGTGSGKTESFLLPVIQNAFDDAVRFRRPGLTAILVYPMNALANDQKQRIESYLQEAGFAGAVRVEQYDRGTPQSVREEMRKNPPHILLTNYMMLEYLLVRPADREDIFANHRCRFLVLDEVHTYRGILGTNIALLVRRLRVHLQRARQNWRTEVADEERPKRFPRLVPVGTSATIKSLAEADLPREEIVRQRDEAVQQFFGTLTGEQPAAIKVLGEELRDVPIPAEAAYPERPGDVASRILDVTDIEAVRQALCQLAGLPTSTPLEEAGRRCRLLWDLNHWLVRKPMSLGQIAQQLKEQVPARAGRSLEELVAEVEAGLVIGAALPDGIPGALRLRAHRFIRGGWKFYRCVNPDCGKLHPMGEETCRDCNHKTAPLYLCRNCGADYLRLVGSVESEPLRPSDAPSESDEWMVFEPARFELPPVDDEADDEEETNEASNGRRRRGRQKAPAKPSSRQPLAGSLDPATLSFSIAPEDYRLKVLLTPSRTRCLCCGGTAGSRSVLTPVALGTSAAVKVVGEGLVEALAEANRGRTGHDGKERLLIFSDSRQDAAHQARFLIFASRYDRMRRRMMQILAEEPVLTIEQAVARLSDKAVVNRDNPYSQNLEQTRFIPDDVRARIKAWEEAPLLDEIAVNAGYRGTLVNLGLVGVQYHQLVEAVEALGGDLANALGIHVKELEYICRVLLDEMRTRGAMSRDLLRYHEAHVAFPRELLAAEWERRTKRPQGYPITQNGDGEVVAYIDAAEVAHGVKCNNAWRRPGVGGRGPSVQRLLTHLLKRFGGSEPTDEVMVALLRMLKSCNFLTPSDLYGAREKCRLLQVNEGVVRLYRVEEDQCRHCQVCGDVRHGAPAGMPCPRCHGQLVVWRDAEVAQNRSVKRIRKPHTIPLVAGEHTAQITTDARARLEEEFKSPAGESPINVLACSPTLEMGIDVGGLDAVVMRNVPPRPDNYAQRGGRAGRRSRVGIVLGYARSTPHDQYFYEKPQEMIAGEVPAPAMSLGNRDVLVRHLYAIVFGAAEPGLAGRMENYVTAQGEINEAALKDLIDGVQAQTGHAIQVAKEAWGADVLQAAGLDEAKLREWLAKLPERIRTVIQSTARQVIELRQALDQYARSLEGRYAGTRAAELVARLLGIRTGQSTAADADDRSAGYPLRRFAEFGLLPGYEFPAEPAALRLLGDDYEEDPISVTRRFGIGQFQPDAHVYARRRRWRVIGLDLASPWNPRSEEPTWSYRICGTCDLRYSADQPRCPRCSTSSPGEPLPAYDFAGFLAKKEEHPILDEEDRYAVRNLVKVYPQWDGDVTGRWKVGNGWALRLSCREQVQWVNEGPPPTASDRDDGVPLLHQESRGYLLCPSCGRMLEPPPPLQNAPGGRRNAGGRGRQNTGGHADNCPRRGSTGQPLAITTHGGVEVLRLLVPVPHSSPRERWLSWGLSLGYSLMQGIEHHFALHSGELDFELEGPWNSGAPNGRYGTLSLAFIDPSLGGSGYLPRIAENFHQVAAKAIEHLDHPDCETACYRCLKAYSNQRFHEHLSWPQVISALEELAAVAPQKRPLQTGDIDDPAPWLEAYSAGVGSPLELKFLRLFEKHGFTPQKQVPIALSDGASAITIADFAVPEQRLAIYVDGVVFHVGDNLRRDRFIRRRLQEASPPWRVEELRAADLALGASLVNRLRG